MKLKRVLSMLLTVVMLVSMTTFCISSNAGDVLYNTSKGVALTTNSDDAQLLSTPFFPDRDATGMTVWLRITGAKEPFYLCNCKMQISSRDKSFNTYHHGQDGVRNAMWKIEANGDYFFYIPFKYYTLSHVFIGEDSDYITNIDSFCIAALELSAANRNTKVALMGIFNNQIKEYNSEFDIDGKKSTVEGKYTYKRAEITTSDWLTDNIVDDEMYDPDLGHNINLENGETYDHSESIKSSWQYAFVDEGMPEAKKEGAAFEGWVDENDNPMVAHGENSVKASFSTSSADVHKVEFCNYDDTLLYTAEVLDGKSAVYHGKTPTRPESETEMYKFAGWDGDIMSVTADTKVKAKYDVTEIVYNVTYKNNGKTICSGDVKKNGASVYDADKNGVPFKNGDAEKYYEFSGWVDAEGNSAETDLAKVTKDLTVFADFEEKAETGTYTVTFKDYDGSVLDTVTTGVHSYVEYDKIPTRKATETARYIFEKWDPENFDTLRENADVKAVYSESAIDTKTKTGVKINKTSDFSTLDEVKLVEGYTFKTLTNYLTIVLKIDGIEDPFTLGGLRVKSLSKSDTQNGTQVLDSVNSLNLNAIANNSGLVYSEDGYYYITIQKDLVNWQNSYYARISSLSYSNGASQCAETHNTNENLKVDFIAMYEGTPDFTVRYYNEDKTFIDVASVKNSAGTYKTNKLVSADAAYAGEIPTKASDEFYNYVFDGWVDANGNKVEAVYDNMDVYASYKQEIKDPVKVIFNNGKDDEEHTIARGKTAAYEGTKPFKANSATNSYIFSGWTTDSTKTVVTKEELDAMDVEIPEAITADETRFYAVFLETNLMKIVNFTAANGSELGTIYVNEAGEIVDGTIPADPTKEQTAQFRYEFAGWFDANGTKLDLKTVADGASFAPKFTELTREFVVTYMVDKDGEPYEELSVPYGKAANPTKEDPTKESERYVSYKFAGWVDAEGNDVVLDSIKDSVTVYAKFTSAFASPFTDVFPGADGKADPWFYESVAHACLNGYMDGTTPTTFEPEKATTRAMLVRVLYNIENAKSPIDTSELENPFTDVLDNVWYTDAIKWAASIGVVNGMTPTTFKPNDAITREQFCTILYRYADKVRKIDMSIPKADPTSLSVFSDRNKISSYAVASVKWCVYMGAVSGYPDKTFKPKNGTKRAEMAKMLMSFDQAYESGKIFDAEETPAK